MNRLSISNIRILVENEDNLASLSGNNSTASDYGYINNPMIINPLYIHHSTQFINDGDIVSTDASICTTVN